MAKGDTVHLSFHDRRDPDTGARVTRLTPPDVTCHRNYFYQKCFTRDGRYILFGGWFDHDWNCYLLDLHTATARQLTQGSGDNTFGCFITPDDTGVIYVKGGRELRRVDLATLHEDVLYTVPDGYQGYGTWVANTDCTKMVGIEVVQGDLMPLATWQEFREQYFRRPRCRLVVIDLALGTSRVLLEEARWLGHPIYRPFDDRTVAYCHEGPHDLVDARMWLIDEDGTNVRQVKRHGPDESCTHEFWAPDGSRLLYVSYKKGRAERWICAADPVTLENRALMTMPPCSHLMSNFDGTLLVGDGSDAPTDVEDTAAYAHASDPYLYLFDLRTSSTHRIARHDTSWRVHRGNRQVTHPHPSFTPDERRVLYTSDREGEPALYLADLPA